MSKTTSFTPVQGPSFPVLIKVLACAAMGAVLAAAWGARSQLQGTALPADVLWLAGLASLFVGWQFLNILFSTTAISTDTLSQGWLWRNSVAIADIAQVRWLRYKPLDRWMAPRLKVRTRGFGNQTFYAADPAVLAVIDLLVRGTESAEAPQATGTPSIPGGLQR